MAWSAIGVAVVVAALVAAGGTGRRAHEIHSFLGAEGIQVDGITRGSIRVRHGDVTVTGRVRGDVRVADGTVTLTRSARVDGDVVSPEPVRVDRGAFVTGAVRRSPRPQSDSVAEAIMFAALALAIFGLSARAWTRRNRRSRAKLTAPPPRRTRPRPAPSAIKQAGLRFGALAVAGGVSLAVCIAALVPGMKTLAGSERFSSRLPPLRGLSQRTTVVAADGSPIGVLGDVDRAPVSLADVPKVLVDAVIATEDRTFFSNSGVDPGGLTRAFVENVTSGDIQQGGSTISQQLVKNRILSPSRGDVRRKIKEIVLAYRLNEKYSKQQILQEYLNTVYFGQGSYGVESAAERYFQKPLAALDVADSALLAGLIAEPEAANPFLHPERARARRGEILHLEVEQHKISRQDAAAAAQEPLPTVPPPAERRPENYFVDEVQRRLLADPRLGATEKERRDRLLRGGLRIETTLDPVAQFQAQEAVNANMPGPPPFTGALVAMDPATGAVRAMVGGQGFEKSQYNIATQVPGRQPGSTWKVVTLAAALEAGYSPDDTVDGTSPCTVSAPGVGTYSTVNAEPGGGTLTLRAATEESVNCAFARLIESLGPAKAVDMAHRLGIVQNVPPYLSITLGTREATPLEMATVTATLASGGIRHDPMFVSRVIGPDGKVVFDATNTPGTQVVDPGVVSCETDILRGVVTNGTGTGAQTVGHTVAGKTGTTDEKTDAWFLGYTPQLATVVWYGASTGRVPGAGFGGETPATIWKSFMDAQLAGQPDVPFAPPGGPCSAPGEQITPGGRDAGAPPPAAPAPPPGPAPAPGPPPAPPPAGGHGGRGKNG